MVVVFFFGKGKVIEWAKTVGQAKKAFTDAQTAAETDEKEESEESTQ